MCPQNVPDMMVMLLTIREHWRYQEKMDVDLASLVDYIVERSEQEGHFSYFESRGRIWQMLKGCELLGDLVQELRTAFVQLLSQYRQGDDGYVLLQMKWHETVSKYVDTPTAASAAGSVCSRLQSLTWSELDTPSRLFHLSSILHTVAAHEFTYLHRSTCTEASGALTTDTRRGGITPQNVPRKTPQTDSGIQRMASAVVGTMFKFYKKRRAASAKKLKVMASMIVVSKESCEFITAEQRARDRGGLYVISIDFLPALRSLDKAIREELCSGKHGKQIAKVC